MMRKKIINYVLLISCVQMQATTLNGSPTASAVRVVQKVQEVAETAKMKKLRQECRANVQATIATYVTTFAEDVARELQPEDAQELNHLMVCSLAFLDDVSALPADATMAEGLHISGQWMRLMNLIEPYRIEASKQNMDSREMEKESLVFMRSLLEGIAPFIERAAKG